MIDKLKMYSSGNIPTIATKALAETIQLEAVVAKVNQVVDKINEIVEGGGALPEVTPVDSGYIVRVDENGVWVKNNSLTALETYVDSLNTRVGNHEISIMQLELQMNNLYGDIQTLGTVLSSIVTGDIGGN